MIKSKLHPAEKTKFAIQYKGIVLAKEISDCLKFQGQMTFNKSQDEYDVNTKAFELATFNNLIFVNNNNLTITVGPILLPILKLCP